MALPDGVGVNPRLRVYPLRIRSMIDETRALQARRKRWVDLGRDPFAPFRWDKCARRGRQDLAGRVPRVQVGSQLLV
jgi:hypothetical protein